MFYNHSTLTQRIGLLSEHKPHVVTHRRRKNIATAEEADVCLANGLKYRYYDSSTGSFVSAMESTDTLSKLCMYRLPSQSSSLQKFLHRPGSMPSGPPPNASIASQSECPEHMCLREYKSLTIIPLGYRIQWLNILAELHAPSVDWKKVET